MVSRASESRVSCGFSTALLRNPCHMEVLMLFLFPELQRVVLYVGFCKFVEKLYNFKRFLEFFWVSEGAGLLVSVCKFRTNAGICVERYQSV